ncbi:MAG TPA: heparinase II/III family protein [Steroidobacteraceae bacterium]|jgi:glycosyltransferase involved in cell wall biosynthesis|nr:heparinase II/III family protein [Steroidobacteraceae bacterium]
MSRPVAVLTGPRLAALSGVSTHLNLLLDSELAEAYDLIHFEVGREGRNEGRLARALRLLASPFQLARLLLSRRAAIVHVNTAFTLRAYWRDLIYMIVARLCRSRVLYQVHGGSEPQQFCRGQPLAEAFVRATLRLADAIAVLSAGDCSKFRRFGVTPRVLAVPNGIDCRSYQLLTHEQSAPGRPLRLLYLGRLVREKGLHELLAALELARREGAAAELIVAGDGPELGSLQASAAARGLEVTFAGPVHGTSKIALLRWADAQVLPSYAEGLPYALLEGMAAGVPAIATRVGAIPDVVTDGVNGLLVAPREPQAIAAAICRLAGDRASLARMSEASRTTVAGSFSINRLAAQLRGVYASLGGPARHTVRQASAAVRRAPLTALRWRINRLRCMTPAEVPYRIARAIAAQLEPLASWRARVPPADRPPATRRWVHVPEGLKAASYVAAADRIAAGTFDVFALSFRSGPGTPHWNRDPRTGAEAPLTWGKRLNYRDRRCVGDIKYLWEINRHLHLVTLAQGYALTRDPKYLEVFGLHLRSWLDACPFGRGPNWCSSLEAAIRLINWSIAWQLLGGAGAVLFAGSEGARLRQRWLDSVYQHARFVQGYFSRHSSANNHLIGEAAGLYIAGVTWPCWPRLRRWRSSARQILLHEALLQNSPDGVNLEQAVCYQQFVLDFLLLALLAGDSVGERFPETYRQRLAALLGFLAAIMDVGGNVPMIGDADDGAVTRLAPGRGFCPYRSLLASGAVLFGDAALKRKAGGLDDKTRWLFGAHAQQVFEQLVVAVDPLPQPRAFADGGYYILGCNLERRDEIRVVADLGPLGYGSIAAHGHADALSFTLSIGGLEFLIDPGTYLYHGGGPWRAYFRGTAAHNTIRIDGRDQSEPGGDFMWLHKAAAHCHAAHFTQAVETLDGSHDGYLRLRDPVRHRRRLILEKAARRLVIEDCLEMAGEHEVEVLFHCAAECSVESIASGYVIRRGIWTLELQLPRYPAGAARLYCGSIDPVCGWVSRSYDHRQPAPTIVWRARLAGPARLRTELMCHPDYRGDIRGNSRTG